MDDLVNKVLRHYSDVSDVPWQVQGETLGLPGDALMATETYPGYNALKVSNDANEAYWEARVVGSRSKRVKRWAHNINPADAELYDMPESGDVKASLQTSDHSEWILLDGRLTSTLTASQQQVAASLGYATALPNATDAFLKGGGGGAISGSSQRTILRSNLPDFSLNAVTDDAGLHNHTTYRGDGGSGSACPGWEWNDTIGKYAYDGGKDTWMSKDGVHNHTLTTESVNGGVVQTALDIAPRSYAVNYFVWMA